MEWSALTDCLLATTCLVHQALDGPIINSIADMRGVVEDLSIIDSGVASITLSTLVVVTGSALMDWVSLLTVVMVDCLGLAATT